MKQDQEVLARKIVTVNLPHEKDVEITLPRNLLNTEKGNLLKVLIFDDQKALHGKLANIVASMPVEGFSLPEPEPDLLIFNEIQDDAKILLLQHGTNYLRVDKVTGKWQFMNEQQDIYLASPESIFGDRQQTMILFLVKRGGSMVLIAC